jgi:hypothetical protein
MSVTISGTNGIDKVAANSVESGDIAAGAVSQTNLAAGVGSNGPAFSAYKSSSTNQTDGVLTKVVFETEQWDTANCYDNTTGRFTPNVAGYYQLNASIDAINSNSGPLSLSSIQLYKNGSAFKVGSFNQAKIPNAVFSGTVYANGTTDYFEIYYSETGGVGAYGGTGSNSIWTWFDGYMVRAA